MYLNPALNNMTKMLISILWRLCVDARGVFEAKIMSYILQ